MSRILIADDDPHILRVMSIWLQRHGHEVVHARNGIEALNAIAAGKTGLNPPTGGPIELVISDMNMPQMDGIELAKAIRGSMLRPDNGGTTPPADSSEHDAGDVEIPILILTARCDQQDLNEKLAAYGVRVFPKPFLPSQLVAEIDRLLNPEPLESTAW